METRVRGAVAVRPGDRIGLGSYTFTPSVDGDLERADDRAELAIEARDLTVKAGDKTLIEGISLRVEAGELVGLMGPSGAGKTTLMKALAGYVRPSAGRVLLDGADLAEHRGEFRGQIGYVPQEDIIHRGLTVGESLRYHGPVAAAGRLRRRRDPPAGPRRARSARPGGHRGRPHRLARRIGHQRRPAQAGQPGDGAAHRPGGPAARRADLRALLRGYAGRDEGPPPPGRSRQGDPADDPPARPGRVPDARPRGRRRARHRHEWTGPTGLRWARPTPMRSGSSIRPARGSRHPSRSLCPTICSAACRGGRSPNGSNGWRPFAIEPAVWTQTFRPSALARSCAGPAGPQALADDAMVDPGPAERRAQA